MNGGENGAHCPGLEAANCSGTERCQSEVDMPSPRAYTKEEVVSMLHRGESLEGIDLRGSDLSGLDLSGIMLRNSKLGDANLFQCNLAGADLSGASLWHANLKNANLDFANLEGADLDFANLEGVTLRCARIRKATFPLKKVTMDEVRASVCSGKRLCMSTGPYSEDDLY